MVARELCVVALSAASSTDVIRALAGRLRQHGHVGPSFEGAAIAREKKSPTGLPYDPWAVALPHAEPEHVLVPGLAIATLAAPVTFRQMGAPAVRLDVSIVVMPALTAKEQAAASLSRVIELLQSVDTRRRLASAETPEEIAAALERWEP